MNNESQNDLEFIDFDETAAPESTGPVESAESPVKADKSAVSEETQTERPEKEAEEIAEPRKKLPVFLLIQILILVVIAGAIIIIIVKYKNFGHKVTQEEIDAISVPENSEITVNDFFIPNPRSDPGDGTWPEDDGVTTILCFGNNALADHRNDETGVCNMLAEQTGAVIYNCSIADIPMTPKYAQAVESRAGDAFNLYFLIAAMVDDTMKDYLKRMHQYVPEVSLSDARNCYETLYSLDFETVDIILIMYDGLDYTLGRPIITDEVEPAEERSYTTFIGNLIDSVELIQNTFPWIRIIVSSPTYAFAIDENEQYVSSDRVSYGAGYLSSYANLEADICPGLGVSYLDNIYGTFYEDIATDYLEDNIHLNQMGREILADRLTQVITLKK